MFQEKFGNSNYGIYSSSCFRVSNSVTMTGEGNRTDCLVVYAIARNLFTADIAGDCCEVGYALSRAFSQENRFVPAHSRI